MVVKGSEATNAALRSAIERVLTDHAACSASNTPRLLPETVKALERALGMSNNNAVRRAQALEKFFRHYEAMRTMYEDPGDQSNAERWQQLDYHQAKCDEARRTIYDIEEASAK